MLTSAVFVMRRTLLLGLCRPAREPRFDPALASPPAALCGAQWDPKPGRAAPPYTGGSSKAPHTAPAEVFFCTVAFTCLYWLCSRPAPGSFFSDANSHVGRLSRRRPVGGR